jgi:hypothetical protein
MLRGLQERFPGLDSASWRSTAALVRRFEPVLVAALAAGDARADTPLARFVIGLDGYFDHHPPSDGAAAVNIFMNSDDCRELYEQAIAAFAADHFN